MRKNAKSSRNAPTTVADVMVTDVISVRADAPIAEAIELLSDGHISGLAVVDAHNRLVGVISASDILNTEAEANDDEVRSRLLATTLVQDIMTRRPLTITPDLEIREAALQMDYADVHRLFVEVDEALVGVISRSDINRVFATQRPG